MGLGDSQRRLGHAQPELFVEELVLRAWLASDAPAVVRAYEDPDIRHWHARSMSEAEAVGWLLSWAERWQRETGAGWAVTQTGELLGRVGLRTIDLDEGWAEVAFWVIPSARGRGVAPRALRAVSDWAFDQIGLHRLELRHSTRNSASCRVANKSGFLLEGVMRGQALHLDGWHDMHLHALLADDAR